MESVSQIESVFAKLGFACNIEHQMVVVEDIHENGS